MFTLIEEYMQKPLAERQQHLRLDEPCIMIGGTNSSHFRGLLAHTLKTTIPAGMKIYLCHACNVHLCSNTNHLYWGWAKENTADTKANGTWMSIADRTKAKYGEEEYRRRLAIAQDKGRRTPRKKQ